MGESIDRHFRTCYDTRKKKQSRYQCVKCCRNGELTGGRKESDGVSIPAVLNSHPAAALFGHLLNCCSNR